MMTPITNKRNQYYVYANERLLNLEANCRSAKLEESSNLLAYCT